ncbi:family 2A encapsulin nanocompartment cargo protein cysteine desulfurase [Ancylobacter lacus]|uniref:family 2A encapsulin nanocompartment cargo protein cysteine desulfurase n=1 Tax=Ancylobacter lacus TaxID=2579970 RepID=UPI001BD0DF83|nr:family 2A encapsulin nanocompartment cargo protein cysteine desulfurase [Ancylobacter lacus]MBS7540000.1 SufS family cysteine desulfurase [Ancylobacter lacus]
MPILTPTPEALPAAPEPAAGAGPEPLVLDLSGPEAARGLPPGLPPGLPSGWPDPGVIAQLANALFQGGAVQGGGVPGGGAPQVVSPPSTPPGPGLLPGAPAVTTLAPHLPVQLPVGPPDVPPVTIPSAVPTPNLPAPGPGSAVAVPGAPAVPQPGSSPGLFVPAFPAPFDFAGLPAGLGNVVALDARRPPGGSAAPGHAPALPAGIARPSEDGYYFLREGETRAPVADGPRGLPALPAEPAHPAARGLDFTGVAAGLRPELVPDLGPSPHPFDPHAVKRDFPILQQSVHGKPLIWLDNAATTQKPQAVIDRLSHFYAYENSNIHRAAHALAARATDAYEAAREKVRRFLNAGSTKDIVFVRGATEAINLVAQTYGRRHVKEGDEIVVTHLEHHANIVPWQQLAAEKGARLRVAPVDDTGQVIVEAFERLINPRTRLVAVAQVSNALGTVVPVKELVAIAHRHGVRVLVDGAQSVSHMAVDVQALDADFFVFSGHKVFGPTGIGVVYGKPEVLKDLPPWQGGGNMIADVTFEKTIYNGPPERFEAGTGNIADAVGLGAAIDYVEAIGMEVIARYEHELLVYATAKLLAVPGLTLIGTAAEKASVLSFVLDGCRTQDVGAALDREGIAVRAGHHCAQPILRRFGLETTVRPSLAFYNTTEDIDALEAALRRIQARRGLR